MLALGLLLPLWPLALRATAALPPLAQDIPPGTDIALRVATGTLATPCAESYRDLEPVLALQPAIALMAKGWRESLQEALRRLHDLTGVDLQRSGASLTLTVDLDAEGGAVVSGVVRDPSIDKMPAAPGEDFEAFSVDGTPAYRHKSGAWGLARFGKGVVVLGDARGLARQLKQLRDPRQNGKDPVVQQALLLRDAAPLLLTARSVLRMTERTPKALTPLLPLLRRMTSITLSAAPGVLTAKITSAAKDRESVEHGVRGLVALLRATAALLEGGAELVVGITGAGGHPPFLPPGLKDSAVSTWLASWLRDAALDAKVRRRGAEDTDVTLTVSNYRALAATLLAWGLVLVQQPLVAAGPGQAKSFKSQATDDADKMPAEQHSNTTPESPAAPGDDEDPEEGDP